MITPAVEENPSISAVSTPQGRPHLAVLDGVRGLAILIVLIHHFTPTSRLIEESYLRWLHVGWIGVDLFFVLSGFLITGILIADRDKPHYFRNFYARRTLRIFPLYYGVLFAVFVILPAVLWLMGRPESRLGVFGQEISDLRAHQVWLWLYVPNLASAITGQNWYFLAHFWSLAIEEHFYLIWPALVILLRGRALIVGCIVIGLAALLFRIILVLDGRYIGLCYVLTPCRLDGLAIGGLIAAALRGRPIPKLISRSAVCLTVLTATILAVGIARSSSSGHETRFVNGPGYSLLALMWGGFVISALAASSNSWLSWFLASRPMRIFGKYSYGLYVYNRLLMLPLKKLAPLETLSRVFGSTVVGLAVHITLGISLTFFVSVISYHLFEARFLRLKRLFVSI